MSPKLAQAERLSAQRRVRLLVGRVVSDVMSRGTSLNPIEERFVQAIYNVDRRLG
jgi:hypothetical protein